MAGQISIWNPSGLQGIGYRRVKPTKARGRQLSKNIFRAFYQFYQEFDSQWESTSRSQKLKNHRYTHFEIL